MRISSVSSNFYYSMFYVLNKYYPTYYDAYDNDDKDYFDICEDIFNDIIDDYYCEYKQRYKWLKKNNKMLEDNLYPYMFSALLEYRKLMWDNDGNSLNTNLDIILERLEYIHNKNK